jgi:hypothetical protein
LPGGGIADGIGGGTGGAAAGDGGMRSLRAPDGGGIGGC